MIFILFSEAILEAMDEWCIYMELGWYVFHGGLFGIIFSTIVHRF